MGEALSVPEGADGQSQDAGGAQESVLLTQLIQLLNQRERHSLLLSDLGALLPGGLRQRVKDQGGLRSWLQRYPSLFAVVGQPGKESVTLCLGASAAMQATLDDGAPARLEPALLAMDEGPTATLAAAVDDDKDGEADRAGFEEDIETQSAVQLRGLPYRATAEDVVQFLGEHAADLAESNAVQLVQNRDGRPSGFARVQFISPEHAKKCVNDLHLRSMEDRYVEVFLYSERPSKGRQRRGGHEEGAVAPGDARAAPVVDASVTREQVVLECRMQMADAKKRRLLLSMLGVALSPGARAYLKQMDQGLKHFLTQFPTEFSVDGGKGCEYVTYTPTQLSLSQAIDGLPDEPASASSAFARAIGARSSSADDRLPPIAASPKPGPPPASLLTQSPEQPPASATRGIVTPSDWGTPSVQWPGSTPWIPPWPAGGMPAASASASDPSWGALPAWPMPPSQFGWPGFPYPPWGANPPSMEGAAASPGAAAVAAAAAAAFGTMPDGLSAVAPSGQPATAGARSEAASAAGATIPPPTLASGTATVAAVRLRGLPFTSVEQDVLAFFAQHDIVDRIADGPKAVNILTRSNGRPSGQAIVQMREPSDAELAQGVLHGQWMGSRYIEVFLLTAEENEAAASGSSNTASGAGKQQQGAQQSQQQPQQQVGQEAISLSMGVPPAAGGGAQVGPGSAGMPATDPSQFAGLGVPGSIPPPWQLGLWSAMASGSLGGPMPGQEYGAPPENSNSWEALFEFLGPEGIQGMAAAAAMQGQPPALDFASMGLQPDVSGYGMPGVMDSSTVGLPEGTPAAEGVPAPGGMPAAATV